MKIILPEMSGDLFFEDIIFLEGPLRIHGTRYTIHLVYVDY